MMSSIQFLSASTLLVLPMVAAAQHPIVLDRLRSADGAAPPPAKSVIAAEIMKVAVPLQKRNAECIGTSAVIDSVAPATGVRFAFGPILQNQLRNAWTVVARHPNCGLEIVRYTLVQQSDGAFYAVRTNRGQSNANESLFGDSLPLATLQAISTLKRAGVSCNEQAGKLGITRIIKEEPDLGPETYGVRYIGSWSEIWPITICGRTVEVTVRFTADGDGGAYSEMNGSAARMLPTR